MSGKWVKIRIVGGGAGVVGLAIAELTVIAVAQRVAAFALELEDPKTPARREERGSRVLADC
ncbi:MAG: hypothetical protein D6728_13590 [Cyanobacteria bacterium J055]|nr:MAG: hypothetical protein D6728_13590 [Cyanobacteria bacterium J055]